MAKEFKIEKSASYFKAYLKSIGIIFPLSLVVFVRIQTSDLKYKIEIMVFLALFLTALVVVGVVRYLIEKDKKFIISDRFIQIVKNNRVDSYEFSKLTEIKRTSKEHIEKTGMEVLELYFDGSKKLKLSNGTPFYHQFREYLRETLEREGYYQKIIIDNEL